MTKKYTITKEECLKQIGDVYKHCPRCGTEIIPIETFDNTGNPTFRKGCPNCNRFTYGVPKKLFEDAKKLVKILNLNFGSGFSEQSKKESTIEEVVRIIANYNNLME